MLARPDLADLASAHRAPVMPQALTGLDQPVAKLELDQRRARRPVTVIADHGESPRRTIAAPLSTAALRGSSAAVGRGRVVFIAAEPALRC